MQISGSRPPTSPLSAEPLWDKTSQSVSLVAKSSARSLIARPVLDVAQADAVTQRQSRPSAVRMTLADTYAQRALAAYESVSGLGQRDNLQILMGVDDYA